MAVRAVLHARHAHTGSEFPVEDLTTDAGLALCHFFRQLPWPTRPQCSLWGWKLDSRTRSRPPIFVWRSCCWIVVLASALGPFGTGHSELFLPVGRGLYPSPRGISSLSRPSMQVVARPRRNHHMLDLVGFEQALCRSHISRVKSVSQREGGGAPM